MSDTKKENLFAKLARQSNETQPPPPEAVEPPPVEVPPSPALPSAAKPKAGVRKKAEAATGRRTNPDYCQASAYVLRSVRRSVDRALLDLEGTPKAMDYSTLVETLLVKWLKSHGVIE